MRKKNHIIFVCLAMLASICTSCLNEIENVYNPGPTAAVVRIHGDSAHMMANTRYGWLYDKKLTSFSDGKCLLLDFRYDPNSEENKEAGKRGYYTVQIQGNMAVTQKNAEALKRDPSRLLPNEQAILYAVNPNDKELSIYLENYLFLPSVCVSTRSQVLDWRLTYDPYQVPVYEDQKAIYSLVLQTVATTGPLEGAKLEAIPALNAFNLSKFVQDMRDRGGRESDLYVQIRYVDQINPLDSTQFTWAITDPLLLK